MKTVLRLVLLAAGIAISVAAFSHAASENGISAGRAIFGDSSLNGQIVTDLADTGFRLESSRAAPAARGRVMTMPDSVIELAQASFAVDPLAATSLRTIALGRMLQSDEERARQVLRLAARMSKRDAITNLWLAQDYGQAGNMDAMLASFDQALRTSVPARQFAMKPLVDTLGSDESYAPLGRLLARRPEWEELFWREFFRNPTGLANAEQFFSKSGITVDHFPVEGRARLYADLRNAASFDSIVRLAAQDPNAGTGEEDLAAGKFVTVEDGNPFGWVLRSQGTYSTQTSRGERELTIDAAPGSFGLAADRVARVDGDQSLTIALSDPLPDYVTLELTAKCAGIEGRQLARLQIGAGENEGQASLSPGDCRFVSIGLSFAIEQGRRDALVRVARVTLRPV